MGLGANLAGIAAKGLAGTVFNGIFGNNNKLEDQEELMQKAWEYEKAGMGLQYNYGQQAADAVIRNKSAGGNQMSLRNYFRASHGE